MRIPKLSLGVLSVLMTLGAVPIDAQAGEYGFAVGAGMSYTTLVGGTPFIFNLRHYREFNAENRWEGNMTIATGTVRF